MELCDVFISILKLYRRKTNPEDCLISFLFSPLPVLRDVSFKAKNLQHTM